MSPFQLIREGTFFNATKGELTLGEVLQELVNWMSQDTEARYEIAVASDSASEEYPRFPVVITIRRFHGDSGRGGRFFVEKIFNGAKKFYTFRDRIWEETQCSVSLGEIIREALAALAVEHNLDAIYVFRQIHLDVGEHGATKDMIQELCGYVRAHGFEPVIKPEAWAVRIADRFS